MRIQHNIPAVNAHRQLGVNTSNSAKNLEKLSSGFRINRAGDDAAGLAISEKMRGQIRGLDMASKNAQDGVSLIQTAEGALNETHSILQRMRELAVQSSNGIYDNNVDRSNLDKEVTALKSELDRISTATDFNGIKLLNGEQDSLANKNAGAVKQEYIDGNVNKIIETQPDLGYNSVSTKEKDEIAVGTKGDATGASKTITFDKAFKNGSTITFADVGAGGAGNNLLVTFGTNPGEINVATADTLDKQLTAIKDKINGIADSAVTAEVKSGSLVLTTKATGSGVATALGGATVGGTASYHGITGSTQTATSGGATPSKVEMDFSTGGNFTAGEKVSIAGEDFTFVEAGKKVNANDIEVGANATASVEALKEALNANTTTKSFTVDGQAGATAGAWSAAAGKLTWTGQANAAFTDATGATAEAVFATVYADKDPAGTAVDVAGKDPSDGSKAAKLTFDIKAGAAGTAFLEGEMLKVGGKTFVFTGGANNPSYAPADATKIDLATAKTADQQADAIFAALNQASAAGGITDDYNVTQDAMTHAITIEAKTTAAANNLEDPRVYGTSGVALEDRLESVDNKAAVASATTANPQLGEVKVSLDPTGIKAGDKITFGASTEMTLIDQNDADALKAYNALADADKAKQVLVDFEADGTVTKANLATALADKFNTDPVLSAASKINAVTVDGQNDLVFTAKDTKYDADTLLTDYTAKITAGAGNKVSTSANAGQKAKLEFSVSSQFGLGDKLKIGDVTIDFGATTSGNTIDASLSKEEQAKAIANVLKGDATFTGKYDVKQSGDKVLIEAKTAGASSTLSNPVVSHGSIAGTANTGAVTVAAGANVAGKDAVSAGAVGNVKSEITLDGSKMDYGSTLKIGSKEFTLYKTQDEVDKLTDQVAKNKALVVDADANGKVDSAKLATALAGKFNADDAMRAKYDITASGNKLTFHATAEATTKAEITADSAMTIDIGNADKNSGIVFQIGANGMDDQRVNLNIADMSHKGLGLEKISIAKQEDANEAIGTITTSINTVSATRADLGALQNRLEHTINNLNVTSENLTAAEARIRDVDMAKEMMDFTKNNILTQAAQAMLAQANQQPQGVLQLLQ